MSDQTVPAIPEVTDSDVYITRAFNAPIDVVWKFWTEPERLAQWFGPHAVHVDPATVDVGLRPGGRWDIDMVDNETGERYPVRATLRVVKELEYLEGEVAGNPGGGEAQVNVVLRVWFHDHGEKTRITLHQGPFPQEFRDMTSTGWEESFEKIDAIVAGGAA
jgi:uncharacterized protein YndB with AHSA1/START domain